ncbi:glycosyltransferase family 1 protein [Sphingobacterium kyonggiense]|uniref:Glycosyltransferase family 1 protein n=1 Tax=Sphingobacterium kyonggiense TaxID=714075 RepID=A0ABP7YVH6_9SPHI
MKKIVISAVNIVEAGTLAILKDCLAYLSKLAEKEDIEIIAVVHKKALADFPNITYIETTWPKKRWINRLWYEYVSLKKVSKEIGSVFLWFSLHDTSPSVIANRRAVYCHNSYSFYRWKFHDLIFAPKIALFAMFTKYIYQTNIHKNDYLVVQQNWFREAMSRIFKINKNRIIVAPAHFNKAITDTAANTKDSDSSDTYQFLFPASPNSHKNFEVICKAAELLEKRHLFKPFKIVLTVSGAENKYASWLYKNWHQIQPIDFRGFVKKEELKELYQQSNCLIYPSKVESWGLPISEFSAYNKPMLLADLPYAKETAAGSIKTAFFNPENAEELAMLMENLIKGEEKDLKAVPLLKIAEPIANNWNELFTILMRD